MRLPATDHEPRAEHPGDGEGTTENIVAGLPEADLLDAKSPGLGLTDTEPLAVDPVALRRKRLARVRAMLRENDLAAALLFDPYNQRYATGSRNMFQYFLRNSTRYFLVPVEGPVILFEYPQSAHVSEVLDTVHEVRTSQVVWSSVRQADGTTRNAFADEIKDVLRPLGDKLRIGLDRCSHNLALALQDVGFSVVDCMEDLLATRAVKLPEEIACLKLSMAHTEAAIHALSEAITPGVTEQALYATMVGKVLELGGELVETRLVSSGERTNPWFNEASAKLVRPGELVAVDTDTVGCFGYYSDFSRTFRCGPGRPTGEQRTLYRMAYDQVQHNCELLKPGVTYKDLSDQAWRIPDRYQDRRYTSVMHGCGMHGESPFITHAQDWEAFGVDGVVEPGMVLCVESYIGEVGGREGVKLEEELVVTEKGAERISRYPFDEQLLGREV